MNTKRYLSANFSWMCFRALMLLLAIPVRIQGVEYRFEIIAQPGDVIEGRTIIGSSNEFNPVDINNHREVAFFSRVEWDGVEGFGVMTQDRFLAGAGKEVDGVIPFIDDESAWLEINDAGTVVYTADIPGIRSSSVFANDNVVYKTGDVVDGETLFGISPIPTINNHGDIVIVASLAGSRAVIRNDEIVVRGGRDLIGGFELDDLFWPRVSETGQTVFFTFLRDEPIETGLAVATPDEIIVTTGGVFDGEDIINILEIGKYSLDDRFPITVMTQFRPHRSGIIIDDEFIVKTGDSLGEYELLGIEGGATTNANNDLAFLGWIEDKGNFEEAIFINDVLILHSGVVFDGREIRGINPNFGLNDFGDLAFELAFVDGSHAIVLATVPEPMSMLLFSVGLGGAMLMRRPRRYHHA